MKVSQLSVCVVDAHVAEGVKPTLTAVQVSLYSINHKSIIFRSEHFVFPLIDYGDHQQIQQVTLPPTTNSRDVEPWIEFLLVQGEQVISSRTVEVEDISGEKLEVKINNVSLTFTVTISKVPCPEKLAFLQIPKFVVKPTAQAAELKFYDFFVEVMTSYTVREPLEMNFTSGELCLMTPIVVTADEDEVKIKITGSPFQNDGPVSCYTLAQLRYNIKNLRPYIPEVHQLPIKSIPVHKDFVTVARAIPQIMKLQVTYGNEKVMLQRSMNDVTVSCCCGPLLKQLGYSDYQIGWAKADFGPPDLWQSFMHIIKVAKVKKLEIFEKNIEFDMKVKLQIQKTAECNFSKPTVMEQILSAVNSDDVVGLMIPYEPNQKPIIMTICLGDQQMPQITEEKLQMQNSCYQIPNSNVLQTYTYNIPAMESKTLIMALQIPFFSIFQSTFEKEYQIAITNVETGLQDVQKLTSIELQKRALMLDMSSLKFSMNNATQYVNLIFVKNKGIQQLQDRINLITKYRDQQVKVLEASMTTTTYSVQVRDAQTQETQKVVFFDLYQQSYETKKLDSSEEVISQKDEVQMRYKFLTAGKMDQTLFGQDFFKQNVNEQEFKAAYNKAFQDKNVSVVDYDELTIKKGILYFAQNDVFPDKCKTFVSKEMQAKQVVKLDALAEMIPDSAAQQAGATQDQLMKEEKQKKEAWYKITIDGNLMNPQGKKVGVLEGMYFNQKKLDFLHLNPITALKIRIAGNQIYDPQGKLICLLTDLQDEHGTSILSDPQLKTQEVADVKLVRETSLKVGLNGVLKFQGEQVGKVADMMVDGHKVLPDALKITPVNALKFKIVKNELNAPDGKSLGKVLDFEINGQPVFNADQKKVLLEEE